MLKKKNLKKQRKIKDSEVGGCNHATRSICVSQYAQICSADGNHEHYFLKLYLHLFIVLIRLSRMENPTN